MLQPQVNSRDLSAVHHNLLKLCFINNRQWFGDVRKISNQSDVICWFPKLRNIHQRDSPESYKGEILESLQNH